MRKYRLAIVISVIICFIIVIGSFLYLIIQDRIFLSRKNEWSIAIYIGESPYKFFPPENIVNPILSAADVTDIKADFVADPFMIKHNSTWYMFFEVMNALSNQGDIAYAVSDDGFNWTYQKVVLDEPFHLSYPYVFKWENEYYMIPESKRSNSVRLYKAESFPVKWLLVDTILIGKYVDPSIFYYNNCWWLFVCSLSHDTLSLYYADDLIGPWYKHPKSPIIMGDANIAHPGGRVIVLNDQIIRYAQDCEPTYGRKLLAFKITNLSKVIYEEIKVKENPILKPGKSSWNRHGMHNIDAHRIDCNKWIACVDGYRKFFKIQIEY